MPPQHIKLLTLTFLSVLILTFTYDDILFQIFFSHHFLYQQPPAAHIAKKEAKWAGLESKDTGP